jgi:hypothetical protein
LLNAKQDVGKLSNVVAAKVRIGEMFIALRAEGFISAHVVRCPGCECSYRIFYRYPEAGPSARERQTRAVFFGTRIAKSHPDHIEELIQAEE